MEQEVRASSITSIVLAGGQGSRLGRDKVSQKLSNQTLLQRVLSSLTSLSSEILVVIAQSQSEPPLSVAKAKIVIDLSPNKGPLGGLYTGLIASNYSYSLAVACDMPLLDSSLLRYLIHLAPGFDAVVPKVERGLEPLHAVYSKSCLPFIQQQIDQGNLKLTNFLEKVKVRYVGKDEIDKFDPQHLSFFNINTRSDWEKAKNYFGRGGADFHRSSLERGLFKGHTSDALQRLPLRYWLSPPE